MTELSETYDPTALEAKWREEWADSGLYRYDEDDTAERSSASSRTQSDDGGTQYVIDTPPPYPTGDFHIGNALGWCYMDFAARYHRMQGENVSFPQGWDCHGLPTEVKVEENHGIQRTEVSREEFRERCVEHTEGQIDAMKETMQRLGFSQDWKQEYRTMDPDYWAKTQRSFVEMERDGYVHRDEHPVNWCPRCETAIADAEVENIDRDGTLSTVRFPGIENDVDESEDSSASQNAKRSGDDVEIATTRPELLAACVGMAVDPDDDRYADRIGDTFEVPLFGQEVELIADEAVDGDFGTGVVMICTFGDKQDVEWWAEYDLDLRPVVTEDGRLAQSVEEFGGLSIAEAKKEITDALDEEGYLEDSESIEQSVGACWRCDTPIEILSKEQWFVRVDQDEILSKAEEVEWIPDYMYSRLREWTEGMDWDWVISRQRVFATPIPAWSCEECGHWHIADMDELPAEPTEDDPQTECPDCGANDWTGETDVMDTWMDSSISALHAMGWPDEPFEPTQLREQGHDIIRTWAFYTILRTAALEDEKPWEEALINGMVLGTDGNKMSKSKDNSVVPVDVVEEHSADAFRQALALGGQPGSDIQFQPKEVTSASRFLTKLWNITRFASQHLDAEAGDTATDELTDTDRWILSKCARVADDVATDMDEYRFDRALRKVREFVWHDLADDYVELVKGRLYEGSAAERDAAQRTLSTVLSASVRMLAPFSPFLAEETYRHLPDTTGSVHAAAWPALDREDEKAEVRGEQIAAVASAVRAWKSEAGMALNAELDRIEIYADDGTDFDTGDLRATVNSPVEIETGEPDVEMVPVGIDPDHSHIGPEFREQAGAVVDALERADSADIARQKREHGEIELDAGSEVVVLDGDAVEIEEEQRAAGETVEVLDADGATVLVFP